MVGTMATRLTSRAMPHTHAHATEPWQCMDAVHSLKAEEAVGAVVRAGGQTGERACRMQGTAGEAHLKAVVWPLGAGVLARWLASGAQRCGASRGTLDWPSTFLHLTAESATIGLRDLDALTWVHEKGRELAAAHDRRPTLQRLSTASSVR